MKREKIKVCLYVDKHAYTEFKRLYGFPVSSFCSRMLEACVSDSTLCLRFMMDSAPASFETSPVGYKDGQRT